MTDPEWNRVEGVYALRNTKTGQVYIGAAKHIPGRFKKHMWLLRRGEHCNVKLTAAFTEHGESAFEYEILEVCSGDRRKAAEREFIAKFNSHVTGYNLTALGAGPSPETRAKTGARARAGLVNTSGILRDAASDEGRRRRSETMKRLNAAGGMRTKKHA